MTTSRRFRGLLAVGLLLALSAAACGDDGESEVGQPSGDGSEGCTEERHGGVLTMGTFAEPVGLDPVVGGGSGLGSGQVGAIEGGAVFDTLMTYDTETGEFHPQLAESLESNDENSVWTLTLRPDVTFGNGDAVTAEAVKASIERHAAEDSSSSNKRALALVEEYRVIDERTLEFALSEPWGMFPMVLAGSAGMVTNPALVDERGEAFNLDVTGAGAGPYEVKQLMPGERIVLEAKDDYWGGPVCIDELQFVYYGGAELTYEALSSGNVDVAFLSDFAAIDKASAEGFEGMTWVLDAGSIVQMNSGVGDYDSPAHDVRVRKAVAYALDPEVIDQRSTNGLGMATSALAHPHSPLYDGNDGPATNVEAAKELVDEVKAEGWDGTIRLVCNDPPDRRAAALAIETLLEVAGMDVQTTIGTTSELISSVIVNKDYDLACWGISMTPVDAWFQLARYSSSTATPYTGVADDEIDAALDQLREAVTLDEQREAIAAFQERWNEIMPGAVWGALVSHVAYGDHVHGLRPAMNEAFRFDDAWIER